MNEDESEDEMKKRMKMRMQMKTKTKMKMKMKTKICDSIFGRGNSMIVSYLTSHSFIGTTLRPYELTSLGQELV